MSIEFELVCTRWGQNGTEQSQDQDQDQEREIAQLGPHSSFQGKGRGLLAT